MASKDMKNLLGGLKGAFDKSNPVEKKVEQAPVSKSRESERQMIAQLKQIKLDDPRNKLPQSRIKELNIPGVIDCAIQELSVPLVTEEDLSELDRNIDYIIKAVESAVREGWQTTAEWACAALIFAIKNLYTNIDGVDEMCAWWVLKCRVKYTSDLAELVKSCIEQDRWTDILAERAAHSLRVRGELERREEHYRIRRESGALDLPLAELEMNAHRPDWLSSEALELRDELRQIERYKVYLAGIETAIGENEARRNLCEREVQRCCSTLSDPPQATDTLLQDRINEANCRYRESLRRQLSDVVEAMHDCDAHICVMDKLFAQSVRTVRLPPDIPDETRMIEPERLWQIQDIDDLFDVDLL